jgi:hypothetical protein
MIFPPGDLLKLHLHRHLAVAVVATAKHKDVLSRAFVFRRGALHAALTSP